jgi:putative transcriptional regulator
MTKLEFVRRNSGLSQTALAHHAGIHPTAITQVEKGNRKPWPKFRAQVAACLNVDESELFEASGWPIQFTDGSKISVN